MARYCRAVEEQRGEKVDRGSAQDVDEKQDSLEEGSGRGSEGESVGASRVDANYPVMAVDIGGRQRQALGMDGRIL